MWDANPAKPEEQATALLAATLETSPRFREALLRPLELGTADNIRVDTEVGTGTGDVVDIELQVLRDGCLDRRAWIEVKLSSLLAGAQGSGRRSSRATARRSTRLTGSDRDRRPPASPCFSLALMNASGSSSTGFERVSCTGRRADIAYECGQAACAEAHGTEHWLEVARRPSAPLELANLETLLWFLAEARRKTTGERIVGITRTGQLTAKQTAGYAAAYRALLSVFSLGDRIGQELERTGWTVEAQDADTGGGVAFDALCYHSTAEPRRGRRWWEARGGTLEYWLTPVELNSDNLDEGRFIWAGASFEHGVSVSAQWRGMAEQAGFRLLDNDDGKLVEVGTRALLTDALEGATRAGEQAEKGAAWVAAQLAALADLSPSRRRPSPAP
ncbi:MAG: hypothetical protein ACR2L9_03390 [Solirubrobacteraceae bacterium]